MAALAGILRGLCLVAILFRLSAAALTASCGTCTVKEGETLTLTISDDSATDLTATVTVTDPNGDLQFLPSSSCDLNFDNSYSCPIFISTELDSVEEAQQMFTLTITTASDSIPKDIFVDDQPVITWTNPTFSGTEGPTAKITISATLSAGSGAVSVDVQAVDDSAKVGQDFNFPSTTISFPSGKGTATIDIPLLDDDVYERAETFTVQFTTVTGDAVVFPPLPSECTVTINDDQATAPTLSVDSPSVEESAGAFARFTFTLSGKSQYDTVISYSTGDGTATAADDYNAVAGGSATIVADSTSTFVDITLKNDNIYEPSQTFTLHIDSANDVTYGTRTGTATIGDLQDTPLVSVAAVSVTVPEGNSGTTGVDFQITLNRASYADITVKIATTHIDTDSADYVAIPLTDVTIPLGDTSVTRTVQVNGDDKFEADETFSLDIKQLGAGVAAGTLSSVVAITNDDTIPTISILDKTVSEGVGSAVVNIQLSNPSYQAVTVTVATTTTGSTATVVDDYTALASTLVTFDPDTVLQSVSIPIIDDSVDEPDEVIKVVLSNPSSGGTIDLDDSADLTIQDNDPTPTVSIAPPATTDEGTLSDTNFVFTVTLDRASATPIDVDYATTPIAPTAAGVDYSTTGATGTLTFAPGQTSKTITIVVLKDDIYESDEQFKVTLTLSDTTFVKPGTPMEATATIKNDDPLPTFSIADLTVNEAVGTASVVVSLSNPIDQDVTVDVATSDVTAKAPGDYTARSTTGFTILAGSTSANFDVLINNDVVNEADETFTVTLSNPSNGMTITDNTATVTITDNDPVTLSIAGTTLIEGNTGTTVAKFAVTLSGPSEQTITVNYATTDDTADSTSDPADFVAVTNGLLTFVPSDLTHDATVTINGDNIRESDETFTVTLSTPTGSGVSIATPSATGTITNDDPLPSITITGDSQLEGTVTPVVSLVFHVILSHPSDTSVSVDYTTQPGTALEPEDYTPTSGTLTFTAGKTDLTISVPIVPDSTSEPNESFTMKLLPNPTGATISVDTATGTIRNDDGNSLVSVAAATASEEDATITFTVTLSPANSEAVSVDYATMDGTARAGVEYEGILSTLTFIPGQTTQTVVVNLNAADTIDEDDVFFYFALSNPSPSGVADLGNTYNVTGTITDDDDSPTVSMSGYPTLQLAEGSSSNITLSLSEASARTVSVTVATQAGTAVSPDDFQALAPTQVQFNPGELTQNIEIFTVSDNIYESVESFTLVLSNPVNCHTETPLTIEILNDDPLPTLSFAPADVSVNEGDSGTSQVTLNLVLSNPSAFQMDFDYVTADGTATDGEDYMGDADTVSFAAGVTEKTLSITINGDTLSEADETFTVEFADANITATVTILNDDGRPTITIDNVNVTEGHSGTVDAVFTVSLDVSAGYPISVNYMTASGTAVSPGDFTAIPSTKLDFAAGETTKTVTVTVNSDTVFENDEEFYVELSGASGATIGTLRGTGTIMNDDLKPAVSFQASSFTGPEETASLLVKVTLSYAPELAVTVPFTHQDITTSAADYSLPASPLVFAPGVATLDLVVTVVNDDIHEGDEEFTITLGEPTNADMGPINETLITITDDDVVPTLTVSGGSVAEGNSGDNNVLVFTIRLSHPTTQIVTANYTTDGVTASPDRDYTPVSGQVTLDGDVSQDISVTIFGDNGWEKDETLHFTVSNVNNAVTGITGNIVVTGTITNDDERPQRPVVKLTLEGDFTTFDQTKFITSISKVLGIDPSRVVIRSTSPGSVIVVFAIHATEGSSSDSVIDDLVDKIEADDVSLTSNGLVVLDVQLIEDPNPEEEQKESSDDKGLSSGAIAAIIVVPLGTIILVLIALAIFRYRNNHRNDEVDHNSLEMGVRKRTTSLPKTKDSKDAAASSASKKKDQESESQTEDTDESDSDDSSQASSKSSGSGSTEETDDSEDSDDSEEFSESGSDETDSSSGSSRKK